MDCVVISVRQALGEHAGILGICLDSHLLLRQHVVFVTLPLYIIPQRLFACLSFSFFAKSDREGDWVGF